MFALSALPDLPRLVCLALLVNALLLLVGGFVRSQYDEARAGRMPKRAQLPQSFLLILLAFTVWLGGAQNTALETMAFFFALGIAFGFLGDLFMANVFNQTLHVPFGMLAFAIGHVWYMLGFREIVVTLGFDDIALYTLALNALWLLAFVMWLALVRRPNGGGLQWAALVYALFLATMAAYALGLALHHGHFIPLAVGAILFLLSDSLIAARLFAGRSFRYIGDVIWTTYIVAQVCIVTAAPIALALME